MAQMTQMLNINIPHLDVSKPGWLFATSCRLFNKTGMVIYRSVWMRETDPMYDTVRDFVKDLEVEVVYKGLFEDARMIFKEGEITIQLLQDKGSDPTVLDPAALRELQAMGERIVREMMAKAS
jgi:hypothetical protein